MQDNSSSATDARIAGTRIVGFGIAAIVVILGVTALLLFLNLPDADAFNTKVERIFIENDDLTSPAELRLLEILAQSGTAFAEVIASYRVSIFVLLVFSTGLLIAALVFLVMIVVLASLGSRSALLVGFAIPTSFLLCFAFLAIMEVSVSNIVMFGLILAVGMLVDGAIVVVEYADRRIKEGSGPMAAYVEAAKRMCWPIVSSTATTLCAFLPMLFWPGVPGQFMGMLPVTLIFVLSASLIVALIYLPVLGGVAARFSAVIDRVADFLKALLPWWAVRAILAAGAGYLMFLAALNVVQPGVLFDLRGETTPGFVQPVVAGVAFVLVSVAMSAFLGKRIAACSRTSRASFFWSVSLRALASLI